MINLDILWIWTESVILIVFIKQRMKLEQIKVAQNMQKLFITSVKLSEFEDQAYFECSFY